MQYLLNTSGLKITYDPEAITLQVSTKGGKTAWTWGKGAVVRLGDGTEVSLSNAKCNSFAYKNGTMDGVRATYGDFVGANGQKLGFTVETYVGVDESSGQLRCQSRVVGDGMGDIAAVLFPPRMKFDAAEGEGYTVLSRMQGSLIPAGSDVKVENGFIYERDGYMPLFGQIKNGAGYAAIYETPFDARYDFENNEVQPIFIPSLGTMSYAREMLYSFFNEGDFNTVAKIYREYRRERGKFVTLREKIARNPRVEYLLGSPIVHSCAAVHIHPDSHYYDPEDPSANDYYTTFAENAEGLKRLKANGAEKAYLHLDGWGNHGYDNLHPSPFPIHSAAGGADGMRELERTCHALGYLFGIHDQYRDYYYDSPGFSLDNAVQNFDGGHHFSSYWFGGPHTFLCAKLAPDYVRRNYDEFERLDIRLDGSYLDVFSVVEMDQCFNPDHLMTREECAKYRRHCLDMLTSRGIIPSSEEVLDCIIDSMALCHHAPFMCTDFIADDRENVGIPIPLFNLVFHECIVIPWDGLHSRGAWSIDPKDPPYVWALLCGGTIYLHQHSTKEDVEYGKIALELHKQIALCELTKHEILDEGGRARRSTFSDGTVVEANLDSGEFCIRYPDGRVVCGKD